MRLNKRVNLYDVEQIFWSVQVKLCESELDPIKDFKQYIIPGDIPTSNDVYSSMVSFCYFFVYKIIVLHISNLD